jgi:hypothetical protein
MPPACCSSGNTRENEFLRKLVWGALAGTGKGYLVFSVVERKVEVAAFSFRGNPKSATPQPAGGQGPNYSLFRCARPDLTMSVHSVGSDLGRLNVDFRK